MRQKIIVIVLVLASLTCSRGESNGAAMAGPIQRIPSRSPTGAAVAVRVADAALIFTGQVVARNADFVVRAEVEAALGALDDVLARHGSDLTRVVRLCAYVSEDRSVSDVEAAVSKRFATMPVAFTLVRTPLAQAGARVAFEAVAWSSEKRSAVAVTSREAAIMPAGGKVFISGQAAKGIDLRSGVRLTMAGLHRSLAHLGLSGADVVQVKAFIQPFGEHVVALEEVAASFGGGPVPPAVFMQWQSDLFAEIELVVSARTLPAPLGDSVAYSWLPWLTKSPRFCNIAQVAAGAPLIFIGSLDGGDSTDARAQMKTIFERLGSVLFESGSSYRQLVKATYYLGDPKARAVLGDIRGVYFDPTRPPAASALGVAGFGKAGRAAMVDMIAVPTK